MIHFEAGKVNQKSVMQVQSVTTQLNLAYASHCVFYIFISQTLAETYFLSF